MTAIFIERCLHIRPVSLQAGSDLYEWGGSGLLPNAYMSASILASRGCPIIKEFPVKSKGWALIGIPERHRFSLIRTGAGVLLLQAQIYHGDQMGWCLSSL
jgi:hypothetical protein